jgi:predicted nucleic acid-binding protein
MRNASSGLTDNRVLVDTNIVVYAYDEGEAGKHEKAGALLLELMRESRLVLSTQTLNEFYVVVTRPRRPGRLSHEQASEAIRNLSSVCQVVPVTPALTFRALETMPRYSLSFWDALIWAAARENGVAMFYTEDLQHGQEIDGVRIVNPFLEP